MALSCKLAPLSDSEVEEIRKSIIRYWTDLDPIKDLSGVLGDVFQEKQAEVTELLQRNTIGDVYNAYRLTARFEYERQTLS